MTRVGRHLLRPMASVCAFLLSLLVPPVAAAARRHSLALVPPEIASDHFVVTIDGEPTLVMHAAVNLYFLNFDVGKHTHITVTAPTDDYWNAGVDVQPWRLGIRPERHGRTLSFTLDGPVKITIGRPNDSLGGAEMLYLFANAPEKNAPTADRPGLRYIGPGAHTENLDVASGETVYLAAGAVVFGALNVWQVSHVRIFGPGVIVYDGPQNPEDDDGWMHKRNWHCIVMDQAQDISISDITCVVRSRTWQIQMKDSSDVTFDNLKVIGANSGNANADGMDWLGGGDTVVRNSFFRAADDVFALQSSWEGYGPKAFGVEGQPVRNILIENTVVSTSISNIVRAGWPQKNFEGGNLRMNDIDVLHAGLGGCGVPFAFMELWAYPGGRGQSANYSFTNIRLDNWYSLLSFSQPTSVKGIHFTDIASLRTPPSVPSLLQGAVSDVTFDNLVLDGNRVESLHGMPLQVIDGAVPPVVSDTAPKVTVVMSHGWLRPGEEVHFEATSDKPDKLHYTWLFGDGIKGKGRKVKHRFPDTDGTSRDGSGLFNVLLHVTNDAGRQTWISNPVVVSDSQAHSIAVRAATPGVTYRLTPLNATAGLSAIDSTGQISGTVPTMALALVPHPASQYRLTFTTNLLVPEGGGYIFTLIANDASTITVDGKQLATGPTPFAQVCGLSGNAARIITVPVELAKGAHSLEISESHGTGIDNFQVLWQGPGISLQSLPTVYLFAP